LEVSLELSRDNHTKNYAKSIRSLRKIIQNHPYTNSLKFSSLEYGVESSSEQWIQHACSLCSRKPIIPHWVVVCATSQPLQVHNRKNKSGMREHMNYEQVGKMKNTVSSSPRVKDDRAVVA